MNTHVKIIATTILFSILVSNAFAQEKKFTVQLSNPAGMIQKAGVKLEYRAKNVGFLLATIQYYGFLPRYPGTQIGLEARKYIKPKVKKEYENFIYVKFIAGHQNYFSGSGSGFTRLKEVPEGDYAGGGGGVGRRFNFGRLFIDLNTGLKYVVSEVKQDLAFYITGPASFIDFHVHIGIQF